MELLNFTPDQFRSFVLVLIRVSIILFMFPVLGSNMIPNMVKAGLGLLITVALFPTVRPEPGLFPETIIGSGCLILSEVAIGLILGLILRMLFAAVQMAGEMVGFQMGFSIINVLDPQSGTQYSILAQMGNFVAVLLFLLLNGHHIFLMALKESFEIVKVGSLMLDERLYTRFVHLAGQMFVLAVKMGAPAIVALLLTSMAFGVTVRLVPQMNILIVAFPLKIVVGLIFFGLSLKVTLWLMRGYIGNFGNLLTNIIYCMRV